MKKLALSIVALAIGAFTMLGFIEAGAHADSGLAYAQSAAPTAGSAVTVEPFTPAAGSAQDAGSASAPSAGSGSAVVTTTTTTTTSANLPNPATNPIAAWDEVKAARKVGWPLTIFAVLMMLTKALAYGREKLKGVPLLGKVATWLSVGKRAMVVTGLGTCAAAGFDVLVAGGSLVAALIAAVVAFAGVSHSTTKGA